MKIRPNILNKSKKPPKINRTYLYKMRKIQTSPGRRIKFISTILGWTNFVPYTLYKFEMENGEYWVIFDRTFRKATKEGRVKLIYENTSS